MEVINKKSVKIRTVILSCSVLLLFCYNHLKGASFPGNAELLSSAMDRVVLTVSDRLHLEPGDTVCIYHTASDNKKEHFIYDLFFQKLIGYQLRLFLSDDTTQFRSGLFVSVIITEAKVQYVRYMGRSLFKRGRVNRKATFGISLRAVDSDHQKVRWAGNITDYAEDLVPVSQLVFLEDEILGHPAKPEEVGCRHWFEPVFVITIMGIVTYLFYTIRSS